MKENFFQFLKDKYSINLTEQQKQVVLHKDKPAALIAVPGSGKTTVLICRTANMILNCGISPKSILSLTFNRTAAREMKDRYQGIFKNENIQGVNFSTIHAFALSIIKTSGRAFSLIEGDSTKINKNLILKNIYRNINKVYLCEDELDELLRDISYVKNMMLKEDELSKYDSKVNNFLSIFKEYETLKENNNYIDFDDMLTKTYDILNTNTKMLNMCTERFKYIQVDEGQDTSKIQNCIIKLIANPKNNVFIVADDDQSIYGFRGAYPEGILNFKDDYPEGEVFFMEENFRSTKNIVESANNFIKGNTIRYAKNIFTNNKSGSDIKIQKVKNESEQIKYILDEIKRNPKETAIIYRSNISSVAFANALYEEGLDFYIKDNSTQFFKNPIVEDIKAFMRFSKDTSDIDAFKRIYYKMNAYINKEAVDYVEKNLSKNNVFDLLLQKCEPYQVKVVCRLKDNFRGLSNKKPSEAIGFIESVLNYKDYLRRGGQKLYSKDAINTIMSSLKLIAKGTLNFEVFFDKMDRLKRFMQGAVYNKNKSLITLSTVHSVKGLEFERVFMIDLIDGLFPTASSADKFLKGDKTLLEEERRLFYVGMTRAKSELNIMSMTFQNDEILNPSRFIGEVMGGRIENSEKLSTQSTLITLNSGDVIFHRVFGKGKVIDKQNNIIQVNFIKSGIKNLSANVCFNNGLIEKL